MKPALNVAFAVENRNTGIILRFIGSNVRTSGANAEPGTIRMSMKSLTARLKDGHSLNGTVMIEIGQGGINHGKNS